MTFSFPSYAVAFAVTLGCIAYMIMLSPMLSALVAVAIVAGTLINQHAITKWQHHYGGVSAAQDELHKQYQAITAGAKELRLNRERRLSVYGTRLSGAADRVADLKIRAMRLFYGANATSATLFFVVIGLILLCQQRLGSPANVVSGFVIVLLYVRGPVEVLAGSLPLLSQAKISFQRVVELSAQFTNRETHLRESTAAKPLPEIQTIELDSATWAFPQADGQSLFQLGPLDLQVKKGETLFVIGENGGGKTTLIKLLLGLYAPEQGALLLNGEPVQANATDDYRQLSRIFRLLPVR